MQITASAIHAKAQSSFMWSQMESLSISRPTSTAAGAGSSAVATLKSANDAAVEDEYAGLDPKFRSIVLALEALTGKKIDISSFKAHHGDNVSPRSNGSAPSNSPIVTYERMQAESSSLDIAFEGKLLDKAGKAIAFSLSIQWKQEFVQTQRLSIQDGKVFEDPLIISLDGMPPVASEKFDFDLTDKTAQLNELNAGAGYLVFDANGNGKADNGSELFGPKSSDGFAELASHDQDGNGWIDSGDDIFKQLRFWRPEGGEGELKTLEEVGIGAISLATIALDYTAKTGIDDPTAHFKEASVAVGEDGRSYGVFSVDLKT